MESTYGWRLVAQGTNQAIRRSALWYRPIFGERRGTGDWVQCPLARDLSAMLCDAASVPSSRTASAQLQVGGLVKGPESVSPERAGRLRSLLSLALCISSIWAFYNKAVI